mgnify:CR=1 FL=1
MFIITSTTKYEYLLATEDIPFKSKDGNPLKMDICQGYAAMFFGKFLSKKKKFLDAGLIQQSE